MSGKDFGTWFTLNDIERFFGPDVELVAVAAEVTEDCAMNIGDVVLMFYNAKLFSRR